MPRAGKAPLTPVLHKQTLTFAGAVLAQLPPLTEEEQQYYIGKPNELKKALNVLRRAKSVAAEDLSILDPSLKLYMELFGKVPDITGLVVPKVPDDAEYLAVLVDKELASSKEALFQARKKIFPTRKYDSDSLDVVIPAENDQRNPRDGSYIVLMRDSETPDADLMNRSANNVKSMNLTISTDTEYALFSALFFRKHGYHPDRDTWTLNAGSRGRLGGVPYGLWRDGESEVSWDGAGRRDPRLGARRVIL